MLASVMVSLSHRSLCHTENPFGHLLFDAGGEGNGTQDNNLSGHIFCHLKACSGAQPCFNLYYEEEKLRD